jgi:hypothetical protein
MTIGCELSLGLDAKTIPIIPIIFEATIRNRMKPISHYTELFITKPINILETATIKLALVILTI